MSAGLQEIVDSVRLVPEQYRVYDQSTATAQRIYGLAAPVLSDLLDLGFPHRVEGGERYFDELDLANASLTLRLPSPRYLAMRRWPQIFRAIVDDDPIRYEVEVVAECGADSDDHECDFVLAQEVRALGVELDPSGRRFTLRREVGGTGPAAQAPPELVRLFGEVSRFRFHVLPVAMFGDLSFAEETGLANCELASRHLVQRAAEEGWEARRSSGLLLSSPYSLEHFWPEIRLAGTWTAFDPYMIKSLERWGVLEPSEVSPAQVLNSGVVRIAENWVDLVEDAGRPARLSLLTRRKPLAGSPAGGAR
jgi:hypothetical protein